MVGTDQRGSLTRRGDSHINHLLQFQVRWHLYVAEPTRIGPRSRSGRRRGVGRRSGRCLWYKLAMVCRLKWFRIFLAEIGVASRVGIRCSGGRWGHSV